MPNFSVQAGCTLIEPSQSGDRIYQYHLCSMHDVHFLYLWQYFFTDGVLCSATRAWSWSVQALPCPLLHSHHLPCAACAAASFLARSSPSCAICWTPCVGWQAPQRLPQTAEQSILPAARFAVQGALHLYAERATAHATKGQHELPARTALACSARQLCCGLLLTCPAGSKLLVASPCCVLTCSQVESHTRCRA